MTALHSFAQLCSALLGILLPTYKISRKSVGLFPEFRLYFMYTQEWLVTTYYELIYVRRYHLKRND